MSQAEKPENPTDFDELVERSTAGIEETQQQEEPLLTPGLKKLLTICGLVVAGTMVLGGGISLLYNFQHRDANSTADNSAQTTVDSGSETASADAEVATDSSVQINAETSAPAAGSEIPNALASQSFEMRAADKEWVAATAETLGIPETAMSAYAGAALTLQDEKPDCRLGWNTLAAIGHVETGHGSINGAKLNKEGRALPRIVGPALDGTEFNAIYDTDQGAFDADPQWDRAIGPLQFIPQTWAQYHRDATGDGVADIDNIFDQALSAATLLCSVGGDLTVHDNWVSAIAAYNPSVAYNNKVAEAADSFAKQS